MADETRQFLNQAVGDMVSLTKRRRYIARIEAAAKELGMRIAEYDEYLRTPEGIAEQQQWDQEQFVQQNQAGDMCTDEGSPSESLA
jgi:predicted fused transcriptional regulator/phosphomethylpyrimidine kinase